MALAAKRRCPEPGCTELTDGGRCKEHRWTDQTRQTNRERQREHGGWYSKAPWRNFRAWFVAKHPLCVLCKLDGQAKPVDVVDHIFGRDEQPQWALCEDACQSLCHAHHNSKTVRQTANGYKRFVVCGAPCSGKTTWVRRFSGEDTVGWDADVAVERLTGIHGHDQDWSELRPMIQQQQDEWQRHAAKHSGMVFCILTDPRQAWAVAKAIGAEVVAMDVDREECMRRLAASGRTRREETERVIHEWYGTRLRLA